MSPQKGQISGGSINIGVPPVDILRGTCSPQLAPPLHKPMHFFAPGPAITCCGLLSSITHLLCTDKYSKYTNYAYYYKYSISRSIKYYKYSKYCYVSTCIEFIIEC